MKLRNQLLKIRKRNSIKSERKVAEILKKNHILFKAKWRIKNREVDFLVGKVILEVDGSAHIHIDTEREKMLMDEGYTPIHISIKELYEDKTAEEKIINLTKN